MSTERDLKICMAVYNATFESCQDGDGEVDFRPILATIPPEPVAVPEPGTTEYGSLVNKAAKEADQCFSIHAERFKWLCKFEQTFRALATQQQDDIDVVDLHPEAQQPAHGECGCCNGSGWMARDPDIGTDQECFVCKGTGKQDTEKPAQALTDDGIVDMLNSIVDFGLISECFFDYGDIRIEQATKVGLVEFARALLTAK